MKISHEHDHDGDLYFTCNHCNAYSRNFEPHHTFDFTTNTILYNEELVDGFIIKCYRCTSRYELIDLEENEWKELDVTE